MSFLTKYNSYALPSEDLLCWHSFDSASDSGPNENDLSFVFGDSSLFSLGKGIFNGHNVKAGDINSDSFSVFIDFEKDPAGQPNIILSNNALSYGFFLGCTEGGRFFIYTNSAQGKTVKIFESINTSNRSILIFARSGNSFTLSSYDPVSHTLESESITLQPTLSLGSGSLKFGSNSSDSPSEFLSSKMTLYEMAVISGGLPSFVLIELCREIYISSGSPRSDFLFKSLSVFEKELGSHFDNIELNSGFDTGLNLPYSEILSGFSFFPVSLASNARFFRNGELEAPSSIFPSYVTFSGGSKEDSVVLDNFGSGVSVVETGISFTGTSAIECPKNKPSVYSPGRITSGFVTLDTNSPCFMEEISFPGDTTLVKI